MSRNRLTDSQQQELTIFCNSLLERNIPSSLFPSIEIEIHPQFEEKQPHNAGITISTLNLMALCALREMFQKRIALIGAKGHLFSRATDNQLCNSMLADIASEKITEYTREYAYTMIESSLHVLNIRYLFVAGDMDEIIGQSAKAGTFKSTAIEQKALFIRQFANYVADSYSRCVGNIICSTGEVVPGVSVLDSDITRKLAELYVSKEIFEDIMVGCGYEFTNKKFNELRNINSRTTAVVEPARAERSQVIQPKINYIFVGVTALAAVVYGAFQLGFFTNLVSNDTSDSYNKSI